MFTYQGKTALITGASSGIGRAFAQALARRGMSVVLVARSEERMRILATELSQRYGVRTEVIPADLSQEDATRQIRHEIQQRGLAVDLLVNNAGFATNGYFEKLSPERDHDQVMVDVAAVVHLTHAFVPALLEHSPGAAIINVASTAGFQPVPYMAVYGASKAFVLSFPWLRSTARGVCACLPFAPVQPRRPFSKSPESRHRLAAGARRSRSSPRAYALLNGGQPRHRWLLQFPGDTTDPFLPTPVHCSYGGSKRSSTAGHELYAAFCSWVALP